MKEVVNNITGEIIEINDPEAEAHALAVIEQNKQQIAEMFTEQVDNMYAQYEYWKEQKEIFEYKLREACKGKGIQKIENEYFTINYIPAHKTKRVDTELMKKAGIYDAFTKESDVKESVRVKFK